MAVLFLIFWGTLILFSFVAIPIYNHTDIAWGFPPLHILASKLFVVFFVNKHSDRCVVLSQLVWFSFPWSLVFEHLFIHLLSIYRSLEKCLFRSSVHFLIRLFFFFFNVEYMIYLYILDINSLSVILFTSIFFHSVGFLFVCLIVSFAMQKLFL